MPYDTETQAAYAELLHEYPWDFYSTVTFRKPRRDSLSAGQSVSQSLSTLGSSRAFLAVEHHQTGMVHVHSLSRHLYNPSLSPHAAYRYLFKAHGRTTVEPIRDSESVTAYCAKYVTKGMEFLFEGYPENWVLDKL